MMLNVKNATIDRIERLMAEKINDETMNRWLDSVERRNDSSANEEIVRLNEALVVEKKKNEQLIEAQRQNNEAIVRQTNDETNERIEQMTTENARLNEARNEALHVIEEQKSMISTLNKRCGQLEASLNERPTAKEPIALLAPFPQRLLDLTAERLSTKYGRDVTPKNILTDIFLRYTIERNAEWFYPWVIAKNELVQIAHEFNDKITSYNQIKTIIAK